MNYHYKHQFNPSVNERVQMPQPQVDSLIIGEEDSSENKTLMGKYTSSQNTQDKENYQQRQTSKHEPSSVSSSFNHHQRTSSYLKESVLQEMRNQINMIGNEENFKQTNSISHQIPKSQVQQKQQIKKKVLQQTVVQQNQDHQQQRSISPRNQIELPEHYLNSYDEQIIDIDQLVSQEIMLETFHNQFENNRNSQPPLQYYSHNSDEQRTITDKKGSIKSVGSAIPGKKVKANHQNSMHKKSQSLFNQKIVDIIAGLQQSLGVIASNVKNSFNNDNLNQLLQQANNGDGQNSTKQKKTLIESAILAQKLAKMTSAITNQINHNEPRVEEENDTKRPVSMSKKRSISKQGGQGPSQANLDKGMIKVQDELYDHLTINSNRASLENKKPIKGQSKQNFHQRTKSDAQGLRKQNRMPQTLNYGHQYSKKNANQVSFQVNSIDKRLPQQQTSTDLISGTNKQIITRTIDENNNQNIQNKILSNQQQLQNGKFQLAQQNIKPQTSTRYHHKKSESLSNNMQTLTVDNSRGSLPPNLQGERFSDANFINQLNQKGKNLILGNLGFQYQVESRLKSAASSPSLHQHVPQQQQYQQQSTAISKKKKKSINGATEFNFIQQNTNLGVKKSKIINKKKSTISSNQSNPGHGYSIQKGKVTPNNNALVKQAVINQYNHKRVNSDAITTNNMFQFKSSLIHPSTAQSKVGKKVTQINKKAEQKILIKGIQTPSSISQALGQPNLTKIQMLSHLSSKRPSNEEDLTLMSYNSPRQCSQNRQQASTIENQVPMQNPTHQQQKDVYRDMKLLLKNFSQKEQNKVQQQQPIYNNQRSIPSQSPHISQKLSQQIINIAMNNGITRTTGVSNSTGESMGALSIGSLNQKKQSVQIIRGNTSDKSSIQTSLIYQGGIHKQQTVSPQIYDQNAEQKQNQPQINILKESLHKRAKSDFQNHLVNLNTNCIIQPIPNLFTNNIQQQINNNQAQTQNGSNNNNRIFFLNNNIQASQNHQFIYSARQSPGHKNDVYSGLDESLRKQQQLTNRSEKQSIQKSNKVLSNQTTMKKPLVGYTIDQDIPQFDVDNETYNRANLLFNNLVGETIDQRQANLLYGDQKQINLSKISDFSDDLNQNIRDMEDLDPREIKNKKKIQRLSEQQSPQMKVFPTPKAIQPGFNFDAPTAIQFTEIQEINRNQISQQQDKIMIQTLDSHRQFDTFDSNITCNDNLSPRSKDKRRLIKQIQVSFNRIKEPLKTTSEFYRIGKMLGKGAFGRVNLAIHKLCEQLVAVKSINKQFLSQDEDSKKKVMQEVLILQKTRHQNIVKLYDSFETNKHIVFVMELCAGGDLLNYVRKRRKLKEDVAKYVLKQVVEGLLYCHGKKIVHRDIKLDNLLLDEHGQVKICDFGVSKLLKDPNEIMTEQCGTPAYIAPEILKDKGYRGFGVDIWSLGVCLYAMLYGTVPFKANNMSELHQLIMKAKYSLKDDKVEVSEDAKSLIRALLEPDPSKRLNIEQVKKHPWLEEAYLENAFIDLEIFTEAEKQTILKDFTYQDMARFKRNEKLLKQQLSTEHYFTEHALDSTQNALIKNSSTKSVILAPFNSTLTHIDGEKDEEGDSVYPALEFDKSLLVDKKYIKFAPRVKDINRQYEMNNNGEVDNGVYNKFVRQSTENLDYNDLKDKSELGGCGKNLLSQDNSLVKSVNDLKRGQVAPVQTENSDEQIEAEVIKHNQIQSNSELRKMQSLLQFQVEIPQIQESQLIISNSKQIFFNYYLDYDVINKVQIFGYPRNFIVESLEKYEMNDASTSYFLLEKDKLNCNASSANIQTYFYELQ